MSATISKAGPYYSSGSISFSSLRSNFRAQVRKETSSGSETFNTDTSPIKASELLRNTTTTDASPKVPDATENASISAALNWKLSQFRGSIKYYYIAQSGTELNFDIDAQSWNNNLNKNIRKFLFVDGTCGSNDATIPAASLSATAFNLTVDNYGTIMGASGRGGGTGSGAPAISGQKGGDALEMTSTSGSNNIVLVRTGSRLYAGGGGGEKGKTGSNGADGTCSFQYSTGTHCQGNAAGSEKCNQGGSACRTWWDHCCEYQGSGCVVAAWGVECCYTLTKAGAPGGEGGNGGPGRGYNWQEPNSLVGSTGTLGTPGGCPTYGGSGITGETGGNGGEWGLSGENRADTGSGYVSNIGNNGGNPGRAVFGSNYSMSGPYTNADIVKGSYT